MSWAGIGLTTVATEDLRTLLRVLHRGELTAPFEVTELARCGLQHCATALLHHLRGLDTAAVRAVVVAVIAERTSHDPAEGNV